MSLRWERIVYSALRTAKTRHAVCLPFFVSLFGALFILLFSFPSISNVRFSEQCGDSYCDPELETCSSCTEDCGLCGKYISINQSRCPFPLHSFSFHLYINPFLFSFSFFSSSQINRSVLGLLCALARGLATKECACAIILGLALNVIKVISSLLYKSIQKI